MVKADSPELCHRVMPTSVRENCLARYTFFHMARHATPPVSWPEIMGAGLRFDCLNPADEIEVEPETCDWIAKRVSTQTPDDCPPGMLHTMCVAIASSDPSLCEGDEDCEELAGRLRLLAEGGLGKVAEVGTFRDRAVAAAAMGRSDACEQLVQAFEQKCEQDSSLH